MLLSSRCLRSATLRLLLARFVSFSFLLLSLGVGQARATIAFVQSNSATPQSPQTTVGVVYTLAQTAGNLNVVVVGWNDSTATVSSVVDAKGNMYLLAAAPVVQTGTATQAIYYAKNIVGAAAGTNSVTVTFSVAAVFADIRIAEYSGLDQNNPLDVSVGAQGTTTSVSNSGTVTTTNANDLLVGANLVQSTSTAAGTGFTSRGITADGDILEDRVVTTTGSYSATATLDHVQPWVMQMVAFRAAGGTGGGPNIASVSPASGQVGTAVTITGTNFGIPQGTSTVTFNGTPAGAASSWSATSITVLVPSGASTGNVVVTVGGVASNGIGFTVTPPLPSITSLNPTSGPVGTSVTITGSNFGATQGSSSVTFAGNAGGAVTNWSSTSIVVTVPAATQAGGGAITGPVVVTVGGVASNGVTFTVTPSIISLTPASGPIGTSVVISGGGFGLSQGTSTVTFNGIAATPTTWLQSSITVPVPSGATTGNIVVTVGGVSSNASLFTVTPSITSLNPTSGPVGTSVTITGANFGGTQGTSTVTFSGTAATPTSWNATSITVPVPNSLVINTFGVVVTVGGFASNSVNFAVTPSITSLSPTSGAIGTPVTIMGTNFGSSQVSSSVTFNGIAGTPSSWSNTSLAVPVPNGATTGNVVVTVGGFPTNGVPFTVTSPGPSITTLSPASGPVGASVTITGSNFGASQGTSTVTFNGTTATPSSWSATSIVAPVPTGAVTGNVVVTVSGIPSNPVFFSVSPTITSLNPSSGPVGTTVTISGTNFGATKGFSSITFNGIPNTVTSWSDTSIVTSVPSGATTGPVVVTVGSFPSNGVSFTVTPSPTITSLSPSSGQVGTSVTISGSNFGMTQGSSMVLFNGVPATPTSWSATGIVTPVPAGASTGPVLVILNGVASSNPWTFTVGPPPPNITSLSPTSGTVGTSITITGTNFGANQGAGFVAFNGLGATTPTSWSDTSITIPVPSAATTGNVTVTVSVGGTGLQSNGLPFTVLPSITSLSPTSGPIGQSVVVNGGGFGATQGTSTVSFNGVSALPTSWGPSTIVTPVPSGADTGNVIVTVGGVASNALPFTVIPTISSVSPAFGPIGASVTISGNAFGPTQGTSTVTFNGTPTTPTSWSDTNIVAPVPAVATTGGVFITVGGHASNGVNFTVTPVTITSLSPISGTVGTSVIVTGTNFGGTQGTSSVTFNGTATIPTSWGPTSITAPVPAGATTGNVVVTVGGVASNGVNFTVIPPPPSITSLSPTSGPLGAVVTITGTNFGASQGTSTVTFNGTAATPTSWNATSIVVPVPNGASTGNVVVTVGGVASNGVTFTVTAAPPLAFVQLNSSTPQTPQSTVTVPYTLAQTAGNLNVVVVGWNDSTATVSSVADTKGNQYLLAAAPVVQTGTATQAIYYAKNIVGAAAGANTVTVTFSVAAKFADIRIAEYSGLDQANPLDVSVGAQGTTTATSNSGLVTTANANDLLVGANLVQSTSTGAGAGYTSRGITADGDILEDRVVTVTGSYSATATLDHVQPWIMQMVAFRAATSGGTGPSIASLNPTSGQVGASVTISGTNFGSPQGTSTVTFNGTAAGTATTWTATSITIPVPAGATTGPVVVTVGGVASNGMSFTVTGPPASVTATGGTPQSAAINTAFAAALQVTVRDASNNPVNGVVVTFTAPGSGASGTFAGGVNTATTNASGVATSAAFTANATAGGPYNVAASVSGVANAANFSLTNKVGPAAKVAVTSGSGQSAAINTAFGAPLVATVTDAGNNPVSGVVVTFTAPGSGASGTFAGGVNTATTNASGVATSAAFTANATAGGPYNVVASATGATSANFSLTNLVGPAAKVAVTSGSGQSAAINTAFGAPLVATVTDAGSNPVSGVVVTFTAPGSGASGTFAGGVNTATTNASGVATSATFTANATAGGPYNVVASATGATSANFSLTNLGAPPAKVVVTSGSGQSAAINTAFGAPLVATVTDAGNNPVSGVVVTFTAPGSGASGTFAGGVNTATTNASGVATSATFTANATAGGPYTVAASVPGVASAANFSLTNLVGPAAKVVVTSGSGQSVAINTAFGAPLVATVMDAGNNAVSGVVVTFTAPGSGASGTFAGGVNTATTNASGVATSAAFTANATVGGPYNVVASATGATSANFALTNLAGAPASITASSGTPQSATVGTAFGAALVATVRDAGNNPVSGVVVTFTVPGSGASGTFAGGVNTATTNASGVATSAVFTANATAGGPYNVAASVSGVASAANFSLTNQPGAAVIAFVQSNTATPQSPQTTVGVVYTLAQTAGNLNVVVVGWNDSTATVSSVMDTKGNQYLLAAAPVVQTGTATQAIYYAKNIVGAAAGTNTVTVTFSVAAVFADIRIAEYSGLDQANPLDVSVGGQGTTTATSDSGLVTTANANDLLVGANLVQSTTRGAGTGFTSRGITGDGDILEDRVVTVAGSYNATAVLDRIQPWIMQMVAFRNAGGTGGLGPNITSLSQTSGAVGVAITITGTRFGATQGTSTVTFNGTAAGTASSWSATNITIPVPAGATTGPLVVTVGGVASNGVNFTVVPAPNIGTLNPTSGTIGTPITIAGTNFGSPQGTSTVTFNGITATPTSWSATSIGVPVPNGALTGNVVVTVLNTASNAVAFTVNNPGPSLSTLGLTQGPVGAIITITGVNFGATQSTSTVTFGSTAATPTSWSATSIDVPVPSIPLGSVNVVVTVAGVASNPLPFTATPPPNITSISPISGPVGTAVTITGTNFGPTVGTRVSTVSFNGVVGRTTSWSDTSIVLPVPVGATTGPVVVSISGVASNGVTYTVTLTPSITSVSPTSGGFGTSVTITGTNFGPTQNNSTVTFNGVAATPTSWSDPSIVVPVPNGSTSGPVVVTVGGVASNGVNFNVTSSLPIVLVQKAGLDAGNTNSASLAFSTNNTAGNWIAVCIRAATPSQVFTISDTRGNTYRKAISFNEFTDGMTLGIYYAENIAGGSNTITVSDTTSAALRFAILEYSGVATSNSLDGVPAGAYGTSAFPASPSMTTLSNGDLVLGNISTANPNSSTAGTGFTGEVFVPALPSTKLLAEDMIQASAGAVSSSATLNASDQWAATVAAFRAASAGGPPPISVSVSPTTASVATGATQGFTAAVQNDSAQRGVTFSLSGTGCSGTACGFLSNVTPTSVTYTGPTSLPSPATVTLTATSVTDNTKSASATITLTQGTLTVTVSPRRGSITTSQTQQFIATVFNDPSNAGVTWQVDGNTGGNTTTGTISTSGLFTPGTQAGLHTITATSVANASVNTSVGFAVTDLQGVYMYHNDLAHTGQNLQEYALTPSNVNSSTFALLFSCPVDGFVYGQPLYVANLTVGATTRNVVFIITEHDSVYAFDADSPACVQLWKTSFLSAGVTPMPYSDTGSPSTNDVFPEIGITSTPVIDPATGTIYVEAKTKETVGTGCSTGSPCFVHRLHALSITTGAEKFGGPMVISAPNFVSQRHFNRPSLLLANSTVYVSFGSHGDICNWQGWLFGYDAATLAQKFVFSTSDATTGCNGASIWDGGAGPAADATGNVYVTTGNGAYDGTKNWSESAMKFSAAGSLLDWFTPFNRATLDANDVDMGSTGMLVLPDSAGSAAHPHLAVASGKIAILFLLDRNNMGKFNSGSNLDVQEVIPVPPPNTTQLDGGNYGVLAYWNGNIYSTGQNFPLSQFKIANGVIATPQFATSSNMFPPRGATPAVSANGTTNGIVWVLDLTGWGSGTNAILDAYDANNVGTLLFSSPATGTGSAGAAVKFTVPTVANGKVYISGETSFSVFGLLP